MHLIFFLQAVPLIILLVRIFDHVARVRNSFNCFALEFGLCLRVVGRIIKFSLRVATNEDIFSQVMLVAKMLFDLLPIFKPCQRKVLGKHSSKSISDKPVANSRLFRIDL